MHKLGSLKGCDDQRAGRPIRTRRRQKLQPATAEEAVTGSRGTPPLATGRPARLDRPRPDQRDAGAGIASASSPDRRQARVPGSGEGRRFWDQREVSEAKWEREAGPSGATSLTASSNLILIRDRRESAVLSGLSAVRGTPKFPQGWGEPRSCCAVPSWWPDQGARSLSPCPHTTAFWWAGSRNHSVLSFGSRCRVSKST